MFPYTSTCHDLLGIELAIFLRVLEISHGATVPFNHGAIVAAVKTISNLLQPRPSQSEMLRWPLKELKGWSIKGEGHLRPEIP